MVEHISPEEFDRLFPNANRRVRELNRLAWELTRGSLAQTKLIPEAKATPWVVSCKNNTLSVPVKTKRLRQNTKPLLNKLETRALSYLRTVHPSLRFYPQGVRFRLANGLWYKPDLVAFIEDDPEHWMIAYEVKGPRAFRGGFENLKMAASVYPDVAWFLIWEEGPHWLTQEILP